MPLSLRILCCILLALPLPGLAWGPAAHRMVGELASHKLTPAAQAEVRQLLGRETLADVAPWADELRGMKGRETLARATAKLHYVNFGDSSCQYVPRRDCPRGKCTVAAIERYAAILGDRKRPRAERAEALRFLVHFIGDIHQPLHAGYRPDRGGLKFQVRWQGRGSNLHRVWDSPVLASRRLGWQAHARELGRKPLPRANGTPAQWAEESCRITRDEGIYPRNRNLDAAYAKRMRPIAERRVREAAARLAELLERTLR